MCGELYVMTVSPPACSFYVCGLALCATIHAIPHASRWVEARARRAEGELNGGGWRRWRMDAVQGGLGRLSKL